MGIMSSPHLTPPPPAAAPAILASQQAAPGSAAKNARVAAGLAGAFDNTLLTGPAGAAVGSAGSGSAAGVKSVVGQ